MADGFLETLFGRLFPARAVPGEARVEGAPGSDAQLLDVLIGSLPDAAIVLDREGRVVAFNPQARVIASALARGAPASLALRAPEVVEAVREVAATGAPRSVEFSQR